MAGDDAGRGSRAGEVAAEGGRDQGNTPEPAADQSADAHHAAAAESADGFAESSAAVRRARNQLQVAEEHEDYVNVRFSPAETALLEAAIAITGQSVSLLLATAAEDQARADLADHEAARAHTGPRRRPPAEAKRTATPQALFTAEAKQRLLDAAALTGRKTAWYVADAGLRAAAHILRTRPAQALDADPTDTSEASGQPGPTCPDALNAAVDRNRSTGIAGPSCSLQAGDAGRDAAVFAHVAYSAGSGTDPRHAVVRAFEVLSVQLRRVGVNLNQIARAVNATGTAEHADRVLDEVDAAAVAAHDLLLELLDHSYVCTACGHRDAPRRRRRTPVRGPRGPKLPEPTHDQQHGYEQALDQAEEGAA